MLPPAESVTHPAGAKSPAAAAAAAAVGTGAGNPTLAECRDGSILLAYVVSGGTPGDVIATARLPPRAKRWSTPFVVSTHSHAHITGRPVLVSDPSTRRVYLFHEGTQGGGTQGSAPSDQQPTTAVDDNGWGSGGGGFGGGESPAAAVAGRRVLFSYTTDCGFTWSDSADVSGVDAASGGEIRSPPVMAATQPHTWLAPVWINNGGGGGGGYSTMLRGWSVHGAKEKGGGIFSAGSDGSGDNGYGEEARMNLVSDRLEAPAVWRTASGKLRALFPLQRAVEGGMRMSESEDDGRTWSGGGGGGGGVGGSYDGSGGFGGGGVVGGGVRATQLPSAGAAIAVATKRESGGGGHGSDAVVLAYNNMRNVPTPPGGLVHLALALSLDGGDTWRHVRDVEPGGGDDAVPRGDEGVVGRAGEFPGGGGGEGGGGGGREDGDGGDGGSGGGGSDGGFLNLGKRRRRLLADKKKDSKSSKSSSSSSSSDKNKGSSNNKKTSSPGKKKPAPKKKLSSSSHRRAPPPRRRPKPVYAPAPISASVAPDETGGWYDNPAVLFAKDGGIHLAYGYRGLTIKHVVVNADWLTVGTSAAPKTTGLFKGDEPESEPEPEVVLEPEVEVLQQQNFGASGGEFGSGDGGGGDSFGGGFGGGEGGGGAAAEEVDPDPMATFLAHARAHDQTQA